MLACCSTWPELRRYLLRADLLPTRNLERLRNQLNSQQRWTSVFERPVQLYESQRLLYRLEAGAIAPLLLTEPRDAELRQLSWGQQLVTLSLEARDALAPYKRIRLIEFSDLPKTISGKIRRVDLRALEEQRRASGERGPREFSWDELFADM